MSSNPFILPTHPDNTPSPPEPLRDSYKVYTSTVSSPPDKDKPYMLRSSVSCPFYHQASAAAPPGPSSASTTPAVSPPAAAYDINYSPKHARKPTSFASSRNMKNLSLNFAYPEAGAAAAASQSSNYTTTLLSPASDLPFNKPPVPRRKTLTLSIPSNDITTVLSVPARDVPPALVTPAVTRTPLVPPYIPRQRSRPSPSSVVSDPPEPPKQAYAYYDLDPSSTTSTPPPPIAKPAFPDFKLHSPMNFDQYPPSPTNIRLASALGNVSIGGPPRPASTTSTGSPSSHSAVAVPRAPSPSAAARFLLPEELQESNQLNAYPNGPRNVLNNNIFLYSDPTFNPETKKPRGAAGGMVDINEYDLVINVAKECQDLSAQFTNQVPGVKEYMYVPWSHTSSISRDLPALTSKIKQFSDKGLKILVHCQCGVSRSACVIVAFFMQKFNIGVNEAYELLKSGSHAQVPARVNNMIGDEGNSIDACDRICPNMSLIFELMEFGDFLANKKEVM